MTEKQIPHSVIFFPNGMSSVCDKDGKQISALQGNHKFTVEALLAEGFDWKQMPERHGRPMGVDIGSLI